MRKTADNLTAVEILRRVQQEQGSRHDVHECEFTTAMRDGIKLALLKYQKQRIDKALLRCIKETVSDFVRKRLADLGGDIFDVSIEHGQVIVVMKQERCPCEEVKP